MKFRMAENSLFAILLRSPWWISLAVAGIPVLMSKLFLPQDLVGLGAMGGVPFLVIAAVAGRRQWKAPGATRVQHTRGAVRAMGWREFSAAVEDGWQREGHVVTRCEGGGADFVIAKGGVAMAVSARRWKAASLGVEPLRELRAAMEKSDTREGVVVALGDVTAQARSFAKDQGIRIVQAPELAQLLRAARHHQ